MGAEQSASDGNSSSFEAMSEADRNRGIVRMSNVVKRKLNSGVLHHNMKVIIRGERATGKSNLLRRLQGNNFLSDHIITPEISVGTLHWESAHDEETDSVKIDVWDIVDVAPRLSLENNKEKVLDNREGRNKFGQADAKSVDVLRDTNAVIFMVSPFSKDSLDYVEAKEAEIPSDVAILVLLSFKDLADADLTRVRVHFDEVERLVMRIRSKPIELKHGFSRCIHAMEVSLASTFSINMISQFLYLPLYRLQQLSLMNRLKFIAGLFDEKEMSLKVAMCANDSTAQDLRVVTEKDDESQASAIEISGKKTLAAAILAVSEVQNGTKSEEESHELRHEQVRSSSSSEEEEECHITRVVAAKKTRRRGQVKDGLHEDVSEDDSKQQHTQPVSMPQHISARLTTEATAAVSRGGLKRVGKREDRERMRQQEQTRLEAAVALQRPKVEIEVVREALELSEESGAIRVSSIETVGGLGSGDLEFEEDVSTTDRIQATKGVEVNDTLVVSEEVTTDRIEATGGVEVNDTLDVSEEVTTDRIEATGDAEVSDTLDVSEEVTTDRIEATGGAEVSDTLDVSEEVITDRFEATGGAEVNDTLVVSEVIATDRTKAIGGVEVNDTLVVSEEVTTDRIEATGDAEVSGTLVVSDVVQVEALNEKDQHSNIESIGAIDNNADIVPDAKEKIDVSIDNTSVMEPLVALEEPLNPAHGSSMVEARVSEEGRGETEQEAGSPELKITILPADFFLLEGAFFKYGLQPCMGALYKSQAAMCFIAEDYLIEDGGGLLKESCVECAVHVVVVQRSDELGRLCGHNHCGAVVLLGPMNAGLRASVGAIISVTYDQNVAQVKEAEITEEMDKVQEGVLEVKLEVNEESKVTVPPMGSLERYDEDPCDRLNEHLAAQPIITESTYSSLDREVDEVQEEEQIPTRRPDNKKAPVLLEDVDLGQIDDEFFNDDDD
jgi:ribosomal protein L7Ae-like RNA K-turn-binding protein/cytoskeletal protein CcmA (bactofilin family)